MYMNTETTVTTVRQPSMMGILSQIISCIILLILIGMVIQWWGRGDFGYGFIATIVCIILVVCLCSSLLSL